MKRGLAWASVAVAVVLASGCTGGRKAGPSGGDLPPTDSDLAGCAGCHGTEAPWAPPVDSRGHSETTYRGVGSHAAHLAGGLGKAVDCGTCHVVPGAVKDAGHIDTGLPAEVTFSGLPLQDELQPTVVAASSGELAAVTCRNVYCHGATLAGGKYPEPRWNGTATDLGAFGECGSCHGLPPATTRAGSPHPDSSSCSDCHGEVVGPDGTITDPSKHIDGTVQVAGGACNACHGSAENNAPPVDTKGGSDTTAVSVGAHQSHLKATGGRPVPCATCHKVPTDVGDEGHANGTADVAFKDLAVDDGATPTWDRNAATCSQTYCHGAGLTGGSLTTPKWTKVDGTQAACGTCHGAPPPSPHPASADCSACHGDVINADGTFKDVSKHVDGTLQVTGDVACNTCHGNADNNAPPVDPEGSSDTAKVTVGAHQSHLKATRGKVVACSACHTVPTSPGDAGHADGKGDVAFKGLSVNDGASPTWTEGTATCTNTYCHGSTIGGGTNPNPVWTSVDGSQAPCGACHGLPPALPHPQGVTDCNRCHAEVVNADRTFKDPSLHVDGTVETVDTTQCNVCHGSVANAAPPVDHQGRTDTTLVTVGAHQQHVGATGARPVVCSACHTVPTSVDSPGHIDDQADVAFKGLSASGGATPAWDEPGATCTNTYCHGATLSGGTRKTPKWTQVDGTQAACDSCHGAPPPPPHTVKTDCSECHGDVINADGTFKDPLRHVDGTLDVSSTMACTACHGNVNNPAPPVDPLGRTDTSLVTVGAHQSHLMAASGLSAPVGCTTCHDVPSALDSPGHQNGQGDVALKGLAVADGAAPTWDEGTATCTNTYCHGATLIGGPQVAPRWTKVDGTQAACGACHAVPPPAPHPQTGLECLVCHGLTAGPNDTIAHPEKHVNGTVEVSDTTQCNSCHGSLDNAAPPKDLSGSYDTTRVGVGAHQRHLQALGGLSNPVPCATCHKVPAAFDDPGHVDHPYPATVQMGGLASADGASPSWNHGTAVCTNTYCHGATLSGGTAKAPQWNKVDQTQEACGSCHGNPPPAPHPASTLCGACHPGTATMDGHISTPANHINGTVESRDISTCHSCHGSADNNAPPLDTAGGSSVSSVSVGAHQSHLKGPANLAVPLACTDCHKVPAALDDAGHIDSVLPAELTFGAAAKQDGANPAWNHGTAVCSNTYCHGATLGASGTITAPKWNTVDGSQKACGTCHAIGPRTGRHPAVWGDHSGLRCYACHGTTVTNAATPAISDKTRHVNGTVELQSSLTWNASARTCDPACHDLQSW